MTLQEICAEELKPGAMASMFQRGAKAVTLRGDPRVGRLWDELTNGGCDSVDFPWEVDLLQIANNHKKGNIDVGDMLRFVPRGISHFARKFLISPDQHGQMQTYPSSFSDGDRKWMADEDCLWETWELISKLLYSMMPKGVAPGPFSVCIDILKYPNFSSDLSKILTLLADSAGGWTQFGQQLDAYKFQMSSAIDFRHLRARDWFAWGAKVPGIGSALRYLNAIVERHNGHQIPQGHEIIGAAHIDRTKTITALISDRDTLVTEVRDGRRWVTLPLTADSITVFPSRRIATCGKLQPTCHRVLMKTDSASQSTDCRPNITLSLGILDAEVTKQIWPDWHGHCYSLSSRPKAVQQF